jgi:hypothetical protein
LDILAMERKAALALGFAGILGGFLFLSGCKQSHSPELTDSGKQSDSVATDVQEHISGNIEEREDIQSNDVIASEQNFTYFSDLQLQQLFSLRDHNNESLRIVVPTYVPDDFRLVDVQVSDGSPAWYEISYKDQSERCFIISGLAAPIAGDPNEYETISLSNETFGEVILLHTFFDESLIPPRITASIVIPVASNKHIAVLTRMRYSSSEK